MPADLSDSGKPGADATDTGFGIQAGEVSDAAQSDELSTLRAENEQLLAEISKSQSLEAQLKEQIEQQRGELCESAEKLNSLYAQVQGDKVKMQQLQDEYAAMQVALKEANERLSLLESDVLKSEEA
jgi:chromosome segregation ATPase